VHNASRGPSAVIDMTDRPLIVVADDNEDILRLLSARLAKRGYDVVTATDGLQALEAVRQHSPQAVVLDWVMPEVQGVEVCSRLKSDAETAAIPVVMLTARGAEKDVALGFTEGADEYLTKPFDIDELDLLLRRLISAA
jgi:DNA-binding response OmpR family regulator